MDSSEFGWNDISVSYMGRVLTGIRGIKYKVKSDDDYLYGRGNKPLGIVSGNESVEGEIMLLQSEFDAADEAIKTINPKLKITDVKVDIVWSFERDSVLKTEIIKSAKVSEYERGLKQGDKFMEITMPFKALDVVAA